MKKLALICLINVLSMVAISVSAEAKISMGLSASVLSSKPTSANIAKLEKELSKTAGDSVEIRLFNDEASVANWLLRFQQIDAAIVSANFIRQQPAGALAHLADLHFSQTSKQRLAVTTRLNLSGNLKDRLTKAFLSLSKNAGGLEALNRLALAGATAPGGKLVRKVEKKTTPAITKPVVTKPVKPTQKAPPQQKPADKPAPKVKKTVQVPPTEKQAEEKPTAKIVPQSKPALAAEGKEKPKAQPKPVSKPSKPDESTKTVEKVAKKAEPAIEQETAPAKKPELAAEPAKEVKAQKPQDKRLIIFIVLIILAAIIIKVALITYKWHNKHRSAEKQLQTPAIDKHLEKEIKEQPAPMAQRADISPLVVEEGTLGPGKVPELLKRCADLPTPVVLKTKKGNSEKFVYFAGGQVSGAITQNTTAESGVRWNKLGNLLVREKLITSEERDQGMALLTKEPQLRLGEALLKLGLIDLNGLRHALTRQAKVTIYSLILFPEGRYQVIEENNSLPAEESVSLEVTNLIREASHHQSEWTAIRQTLPNLNKKLQFRENGQEKLENVNLAPQQQSTIELVDGKRTINELCAESPMLDYEVYRFLYLMVKTGVLQ